MSLKKWIIVISIGTIIIGYLASRRSSAVLNDITTTLQSPPEFHKILELNSGADYKFPKRSINEHVITYPNLEPLSLSQQVDEVFDKAVAIAQTSWDVVLVNKEEFSLEAIATTRLLRFKDDIVIEVRATIGGSEVHMRSKSRVGRSDFGVNAKRIEDFFSKMKN